MRAHAIGPVLGLLGLAVAACNDLPSAVGGLQANRVAIVGGDCMAGTRLSVPVGRECEAEAMAFDANGSEVVSAFVWTTGDPAIATVGLKPGFDTTIAEVRGRAEGMTTLRVEVAGLPGVSDVDQLEVVPPNTEK